MLKEYLDNSSRYCQSLKVIDMFSLERDGEKQKFNPKKIGNRKLLWHGSPFSNFVGIITNGMRIAPPEAPSSGYRFGKGVYTADEAGKSANYCRTGNSGGAGLFVMCEIAAGKQYVVSSSTCCPCPPEFDSTFCDSGYKPDPKGTRIMKDGVEVPMGKPI